MPPVITRIDCVAARIHCGAVHDAGLGNRSALDEAGDLAHRHLGVSGRLGQLVDDLPAGVVGGGRSRPRQFLSDRGGELPVDGAADAGRWT